MSILDTWKEWDINKKIISIVVACFIVGIIIALLVGFGFSGLQMEVLCDGQWSGTVMVGNTVTYVSGYGDQTIDLKGNPNDGIAVTVHPEELDGEFITVRILNNGNVLREEHNPTPYSVVSFVVN